MQWMQDGNWCSMKLHLDSDPACTRQLFTEVQVTCRKPTGHLPLCFAVALDDNGRTVELLERMQACCMQEGGPVWLDTIGTNIRDWST